MFLSDGQISVAVQELDRIHPFWGTSYLAFKLLNLEIGKPRRVDIAGQEKIILDKYYNPRPQSKYYYVPLRGSGPKNRWVNKNKYSTSGLQSIRTQTFKDILLHPNEDEWAWAPKYVTKLKDFIVLRQQGRPVDIFYLAVWMFRERNWEQSAQPEDLVKYFIDEFKISTSERNQLFETTIPLQATDAKSIFQDQKITLDELTNIIGRPLDAQPEKGGTLAYLETKGIGPASNLVFEPADRLNLITGDNGLGKTFLLDVAWWAFTDDWASLPAYPLPDLLEAEIIFQIKSESRSKEKVSVAYDWETQKWPPREKVATIPGLLVYARVDGSFAVWDPTSLSALTFSREQVWNGFEKNINGLIHDWVNWQFRDDKTAFQTLTRVLERLSPSSQSDLGILEPGSPVRVPNDPRDIPTIKHPYGNIPILYVSAGIRRIITIAYLIVWAWKEHIIRSEIRRTEPERRMVILVDEIEAHLHPQWQRVVLPALLKVHEELSANLQVQLIVSTHSPLVVASIEPVFEPKLDKFFHLDLAPANLLGQTVELTEKEFIKQGSVNSWLMSEAFGMLPPRSPEAGDAIEKAKALQTAKVVTQEEVKRISDALLKYLGPHDEFWPRWVFFAEKHGVRL
ncbi:AAA family ATPase [candidate division KSB1 bacterium]|nr:AAA family ATPase [candidate division KSB1 bacterium]